MLEKSSQIILTEGEKELIRKNVLPERLIQWGLTIADAKLLLTSQLSPDL